MAARDRHVDFLAARRRIEERTDVAPEIRQRVFACWVGLFELADRDLVVSTSTRELAEVLGVSRVTWTYYRELLETLGLLATGPRRGPFPQVLQLVPPRS